MVIDVSGRRHLCWPKGESDHAPSAFPKYLNRTERTPVYPREVVLRMPTPQHCNCRNQHVGRALKTARARV